MSYPTNFVGMDNDGALSEKYQYINGTYILVPRRKGIIPSCFHNKPPPAERKKEKKRMKVQSEHPLFEATMREGKGVVRVVCQHNKW